MTIVVGFLFRARDTYADATAAAAATQGAATQLADLLAEYNAGVEQIREEMLKTLTEEEVNDTLWSDGPLERLAPFGPRFMLLAEKNAKSDVAWKALTWVVYVRGFSRNDKAKALNQLLRDHIDDDRFFADLYFHLFRPGVDKDQFYRAVINHANAPRRVAGMARYALGKWVWKTKDKAAEKEALGLFAEVVEAYGDLPHPYDAERGTLGDAARRTAFEIRQLQVGKRAPEIVGKDVDAQQFKLSDYRGSVVLLVFCGDWCGPCRSLYPHEKELVEKLRDKPFAIVGVNSDEASALRAAIQREKFLFRWFADGSPRGPISSEWNVESWPTLYILDKTGMIHLKKIGAPSKYAELDEVVERLLHVPDE